MAIRLEKDGGALKVTLDNGEVTSYNLDDVSFKSDGTVIALYENGRTKASIPYTSVTNIDSDDIDDLNGQLNAFLGDATSEVLLTSIETTGENSNLQLKRIEGIANEQLEELKRISKYLRKIYNPE